MQNTVSQTFYYFRLEGKKWLISLVKYIYHFLLTNSYPHETHINRRQADVAHNNITYKTDVGQLISNTE